MFLKFLDRKESSKFLLKSYKLTFYSTSKFNTKGVLVLKKCSTIRSLLSIDLSFM